LVTIRTPILLHDCCQRLQADPPAGPFLYRVHCNEFNPIDERRPAKIQNAGGATVAEAVGKECPGACLKGQIPVLAERLAATTNTISWSKSACAFA
jgi:hypothetical protein